MKGIFQKTAVLFLCAGAFLVTFKLSTVEAKADVVVSNTSSGVVLKSTQISTKQVIKVPERSTDKESGTSKSSSNSSNKSTNKSVASRGTSSNSGNVLSSGSSPVSGRAGNVVSYAYRFMGTPYVWGATGPSAFDCSGFTAYVYGALGVSLPHYTGSQYQMGSGVSKGSLASGDLVFFNTYSSVSHVGIYIGNGLFIHASSGSHKVTVSNLNESYYSENYAGARRILN